MGAAWGAEGGLARPAAAAPAVGEAKHAALQRMGWGSARQPVLTLHSDISLSTTRCSVLHGCNSMLKRRLARPGKHHVSYCHSAMSSSGTKPFDLCHISFKLHQDPIQHRLNGLDDDLPLRVVQSEHVNIGVECTGVHVLHVLSTCMNGLPKQVCKPALPEHASHR